MDALSFAERKLKWISARHNLSAVEMEPKMEVARALAERLG